MTWYPAARSLNARWLSNGRCSTFLSSHGKGRGRGFRHSSSSSSSSNGAGSSSQGSNYNSNGSSSSFSLRQWGVPFGVSVAAAIGGMCGSGLTNHALNNGKDSEKEAERVQKNREMAREQSYFVDKPHGVSDVSWYESVKEEEQGYELVLSAEDLLAERHPILEDDHMFSAFVARGLINDIEGYYSKEKKTFKAIVALGREVAGFPRIVHGGLTAAIFDEVFGGLLFCLKSGTKSINVLDWMPAYTVSLQVSYKSKIAADSTVLCTAVVEKVEGRKLYMTATMSDGPDGRVYAEARSIFVRPKIGNFLRDVTMFALGKMFGK